MLEPDMSGVLEMVDVVAVVAICRCGRCKARFRVLPSDVLPRKTYGLAVIEHEVSKYARGQLSLRQVAWGQLGKRNPAHTTLHGWTEGLGAHALGRPGGEAGGAPMSRFVAEAESHVPQTTAAMQVDVQPDPRRYRSEPRRDRLAAVMRTMAYRATTRPTPNSSSNGHLRGARRPLWGRLHADHRIPNTPPPPDRDAAINRALFALLANTEGTPA